MYNPKHNFSLTLEIICITSPHPQCLTFCDCEKLRVWREGNGMKEIWIFHTWKTKSGFELLAGVCLIETPFK